MADPVSMMAVASIGSSIAGGIIGGVGAKKKGEAEAAAATAKAAQLKGEAETQLLTAGARAQEYEAGAEVSDYQAQVARNNAIITQQNADYERAAGEVAAGAKLFETGAVVSKQRAAQGASGVDVNRGSAVDVQASTRQLGALDAATIMHNALRKVYGYGVEKTGFENEATLRTMSAGFSRRAGATALGLGKQASDVTMGASEAARRAAGSAEEAGTLGMLSSLVGGASSVSDKWLSFKQKGITS